MLAKRFPTILPEMTLEEAIESTKIHSIAGLTNSHRALIATRPFRSPHHTVSNIALVGGGSVPKPGEVSLAHHGVLFLDEIPEFQRSVLEVLRQPLEDGVVTISRASMTLTFPARFVLCGAMNPCPCGYLTDPTKNCTCGDQDIKRYLARLSGPLLDRIDLHIDVPAVKIQELSGEGSSETSETIRGRVNRARAIQSERFKGRKGIFCNAHMPPRDIKKHCALGSEAQQLLERAMETIGLSARAYHRILKVARTIADLESVDSILPVHIGEAVQYRTLDRKLW